MPDSKRKVPVTAIAVAFVLTAVGARVFSVVLPWVHWEPVPGMHIHHYVYGIFILAIAGYLAMIFKGDRATSWIALLYGLGIGLTFDEFGMWLNPSFQRGTRWSTGGLEFVIIALALLGLIPLLFRRQSREQTVELAREAQSDSPQPLLTDLTD
jgi:thiol:disulfide interchange protein